MPDATETEMCLSQIEIDPDNVRSHYDPQMLEGLRTALRADGSYINAPTVYPIGQGRYRVKHGSTRVLAAKGVVQSLRVRVIDAPPSESSKLVSQMGENLLQGSLGPADVGNALKRLRSADGRERSLSQLVGALKAGGMVRTRSWVAMHLTLAELAPEAQQLINEGRLGAEAGYQLRGLTWDEQVAWATRIEQESITVLELRHLLSEQSGEHVKEASNEESVQPTTAQGKSEGNHQRDSVDRRWELLPMPLQAPDTRTLRAFRATAWAKTASPVERQLAEEAMVLGNYSSAKAIALVQHATAEASTAGEVAMRGLNALRSLVDQPGVQRDSALGVFLRLRLQRVLETLEGGQ